MEPCAATPARHPAEPCSPTPSSSSLCQWRPAAQRNLRNQWSRLLAADAGRSHASALVNAHLSRSYMPRMDLGVIRDMPSWRTRRCNATRCFYQPRRRWSLPCPTWLKLLAPCGVFPKYLPIVRFTGSQDDLNDSGDGGGAPLFKLISMSEFETDCLGTPFDQLKERCRFFTRMVR